MVKKHTAQKIEPKAHSHKKERKAFSWKTIAYSKVTIIVVLILIAMFASIYFRTYPANLPATKQWAEDSYYNQMKSNIAQQVQQLYPNLPSAQQQSFVNEQFNAQLQKIQKDPNNSLDQQIQQTAKYFKEQLQDENGHTYLLAIDPYVWLSLAENIEKYKMLGDEMVDGKSSFSLRGGREPKFEGASLHPFLIVQFHKFMSIFNPDFNLQQAAFWLPVIIIALAIIPAFFLARKIGGNLAGFIAGLAIGLNTALLGRTPAGFSDTDGYIILFPLLIIWTLFEALTAKTWTKRIIWGSTAGLAIALFKTAWSNWWHIGPVIFAVLGIYFLYTLIFVDWKILHKNKFKNLLQTGTGKTISIFIIFIVTTIIFGGLFGVVSGQSIGANVGGMIKNMIVTPLSALSVKSVGTTSIWPNVLTTVAELNAGSWGQIVGSLGGKLFFAIGILGVILTFFLRTEDNHFELRYAALLTAWFFGLTLAGIMSSRFIALLAAPFAIAFGSAFGILWQKSKVWLTDEGLAITLRVVLILLLVVFFVGIPFTSSATNSIISKANKVALGEVPSMNDQWHDSLIAIKNNSTDGIITSWWDFGHWFVNIARRRVTFDGGDQGKRIYWVGKSLMTSDVNQNKAILRMLNCGQNKGYERLLEYTKDDFQSTQLINKIIYENKDDARTTLENAGLTNEEIQRVLEKTHCNDSDLLDQYYIVSEDMVGKAGVWAHFGDWNFTKAYIYNIATNKKYDDAISTLMNELGYSEDEATTSYYDATSLATNREVDSWISPWPSYVTTKAAPCTETNTTITCTFNQVISRDQTSQAILETATIPKEKPEAASMTVSSYTAQGKVGSTVITPKAVNLESNNNFKTYTVTNSSFGYELTVGKSESGWKAILADKLLANSAFTRLFYFDGAGMPGYTKLSDLTTFTGQRIIVYKVDLNE